MYLKKKLKINFSSTSAILTYNNLGINIILISFSVIWIDINN